MPPNEKNLRDVPLCIPLRSAHPLSFFGNIHLYFFFKKTPVRKKVSAVYRYSVPEYAPLFVFYSRLRHDTHSSHIS
jgi:hypothetical protein